jgi:hypothetical protein
MMRNFSGQRELFGEKIHADPKNSSSKFWGFEWPLLRMPHSRVIVRSEYRDENCRGIHLMPLTNLSGEDAQKMETAVLLD